jgi:predicted dienelactone hydrolase
MKNTSLIIILIALFLSCTHQKEKTYRIGQKSVTYVDESRNRPLPTEIWYPTLDTLTKEESNKNQKELFKTIRTIPNAKIPNEKFPLLIISHGTGGNRFSLTWFIDEMVKEGYVVISLDHYGNSSFNKIPREFVKWWERAIDVQFVLTQVLKDSEIRTKIDTSRIGGVGFSLGGYTNIALAGGYVDRTIRENENMKEREMPAEFPETDEIIDFENDSLIVSSYNIYKNQVKDNRIKAFFVMAPAIGFGFHSKEQTDKITAPIFIVAGKGDLVAPVKNNAEKYHNLIRTSEIQLFDKDVGHYVFLNVPTEFGIEIAPAITIDNPTVDRKKIHEKTLEIALEFFKNTL